MKRIKIAENNYSLRYAAGCYWLIDMSQKGIPYKRPMTLNEVGAQIWDLLIREYTLEAICREIATEYNSNEEEIEVDVLAFVQQLKAYGVDIED